MSIEKEHLNGISRDLSKMHAYLEVKKSIIIIECVNVIGIINVLYQNIIVYKTIVFVAKYSILTFA